jgi:hypothetical protein
VKTVPASTIFSLTFDSITKISEEKTRHTLLAKPLPVTLSSTCEAPLFQVILVFNLLEIKRDSCLLTRFISPADSSDSNRITAPEKSIPLVSLIVLTLLRKAVNNLALCTFTQRALPVKNSRARRA